MQDCVMVKKKPQAAWDFENIPRARKRNYSSTAKNGKKVSTSEFCAQNSADAVFVSKDKQKMRLLEGGADGECRRVRFRSRGGKVWCDGQVFEGEDALRAAFEHIGILAFLRCGKVLSCE